MDALSELQVTAERRARIRWTRGRLAHATEGLPFEAAPSPAVGAWTPMQALAFRCGLDEREMDALWLLTSIEVDRTTALQVRPLLGPGLPCTDVQLLQALVDGPDRPTTLTLERLEELALIEVDRDPRVPLHRRAVRAVDRVVELARGTLDLDRELRRACDLVGADAFRGDARGRVEPIDRRDTAGLVVAWGASADRRQRVLHGVAAQAGRAALIIRSEALAHDAERLVRELRAIRRECALHQAWPVFPQLDELGERIAAIDAELIRVVSHPVLGGMRSLATAVTEVAVAVHVVDPTESECTAMLSQALAGAPAAVIEECGRRYRVPPAIVTRVAEAAVAQAGRADAVTVDHVQVALRAHLEPRLLGVARRVELRQTWDDLVLPAEQFELLGELVARVRRRHVVMDDWGFADKIGRGHGLAALLSGPPGTGKTMIAGLVARELGLDLCQIDLSRVVSKYLGETEKQLAAVFDAAEAGHAILLFDEADSLFGKRTEVQSSNDRYANLETNYLLQRLESFGGIAILTSNSESSIDRAFLRRLAFHVRVPMPDEDHRALIWRAMLPARAPIAPVVDFGALAREFEMGGGYIKNAVVRAAFRAAEAGESIGAPQLWAAAIAEYEALGKVTRRWS